MALCVLIALDFFFCNAAIKADGLDEDFARVYPHMIHAEKVGAMGAASHHANVVTNPCDEGRDKHGECYAKNLNNKVNKFMVLQSIKTFDTWKKVELAMSQHLSTISNLVTVAIA